MSNHPNTTAAALTTGAASLLVWLLHAYFHIDLSIYYAGLIVGGAASVVLFVGKRGLKQTLTEVWWGTGSIWHGAQGAQPKEKGK